LWCTASTNCATTCSMKHRKQRSFMTESKKHETTLHVPETRSHNMKHNFLHHHICNSTQTADLISDSTYCDTPTSEMHGNMITRWNMICHQHFRIFIPRFSVFLLHNDAQDNAQGVQHKTVTQQCWITDTQEHWPSVDQYNRPFHSYITEKK
jgi:hypothetical protein